jgi:hypothetical protein
MPSLAGEMNIGRLLKKSDGGFERESYFFRFSNLLQKEDLRAKKKDPRIWGLF